MVDELARSGFSTSRSGPELFYGVGQVIGKAHILGKKKTRERKASTTAMPNVFEIFQTFTISF